MATSADLSSLSHSVAITSQFHSGEGGCLVARVSEKAIYGRGEEIATLLEAYTSLRRTKQLQTVIVHGKSGTGKTALVGTLLGPVFDTNGYFVSGKFFQNEAVQEPFSAIMAAFSDLCDLVVQSDDFDHLRQHEIAEKLDVHAPLLVKAISNLASLTGAIEDVELEGSSNSTKFTTACKIFLRTLASYYDHPIVIFLDDVQWADEGSIAIMNVLLQDSDLANVMFVLAYRDEESELVDDILYNERESAIDIKLSCLDEDAVRLMVSSIMRSTSTEQVNLLSDLVVKRTHGNPFHVTIFFDIINREGLSKYDNTACSWLFHIDEIQQSIMVSETLADLLTRKIDRISNDMKELLKVASLLGYQFDESILGSIVSSALETKESTIKIERYDGSNSSTPANALMTALLSEAVKEGFVEKTRDGYQFTHDKLQTAFQSLIDGLEENTMHKLIGEVFLTERANKRFHIYKAAVHLNVLPTSSDRRGRARLARINLDAAKYCVEISAFGRAIITLQQGIKCLHNQERWSHEYSLLTSEMMEALARNQLIVGEFEACKETVTEALCHSIPIDTKIKFQYLDIRASISLNEDEDALQMAHQSLATLGMKMPRKMAIRHVLMKLLKVKWMLKNISDEKILNLPSARDPFSSDAIRLLMTLCSHYLLRKKQLIGIFSALLAIELTLENGLSAFSSGAFTFYGIVELALGNSDRAYRFGKLALSMFERTESKEAEFATIGFALTMLTFRREPFKELVEPLRLAGDSGFAYGNMGYATYCIVQSYGIRIHLGTNLAILEESLRASYANFLDLGQGGLLLWLQPILQYALNMQEDVISWDNISLLSGEMMTDKEFLNGALERKDRVLLMITYLRKARIACDFGQFELAESYFDIMTNTLGENPVQFTNEVPPYYWDVARTHLGLYGSSGQRRNLKQGRKYMKLLQQMVNEGCPDASVRLVFLEAQKAAVRNRSLDNTSLRATYQYALDYLAESDYMVLEGLLSENAGFDFAKRGLRTEAKVYFDRALYIYGHTEWGARAKHNQLSQAMLHWTELERTLPPPEVTFLPCINID